MAKILLVTNEFSYKNYSITSLIFFFSTNHLLKKNNQFHLLVSKITKKDTNKIYNISKIEFKTLFFFSNLKKIIKLINQYDIIHVHGVWAPIQILSIIISNFLNKITVIQPHGMYISEALKSQSSISYLVKVILIFFKKFFFRNQNKFIAITKQEKNSILEIFPSAEVNEIANPLPFPIISINRKILEKNFVFFGRINKIKNIHIIIDAFIEARLGSEWKLKIYGIPDDKNYKDHLNNKIKKLENIFLLDPVFNENKSKILTQSWCNIILSKSEVLSLSIIESIYYELPSLVSSEIDLKTLGASFVITKPKIQDVAKKIKEISYWDRNKRLQVGKELKISVEKKYKPNDIIYNYNLFYRSISEKSKYNKKISISLFEAMITSFVYCFNLLFPSLLVIISTFFSFESLAAELAIGSGLFLCLTQILSSNKRTLIISDNNLDLIDKTKIFRVLISIIFFLLLILIYYFFNLFDNINLIILVSTIIILQWIFEMDLARSEVQNNFVFLLISSILSLFYILLSILILWAGNLLLFKILLLLIITNLLIVIFFYNNIFSFVKLRYLSYKTLFSNFLSLSFLSSLAIISSIYGWRLIIYYFTAKKIAAIFFSCFALASFPGTFLNSILGPILIKNKLSIKIENKVRNFLMVLFVFFLIISFFIFRKMSIEIFDLNLFSLFTLFLSLAGSIMMTVSMYYRILMLEFYEMRNKIFLYDIIYSIFLTNLVPLLYFSGGYFLISFSFFLGSFFSILIYYKLFIDFKNNHNFK